MKQPHSLFDFMLFVVKFVFCAPVKEMFYCRNSPRIIPIERPNIILNSSPNSIPSGSPILVP